jgi:transcriptional regulator with XRE-family HTH domain
MDVDISKKVKELRKSKELSIATLSKLSGVSTGLISQIERGLVVPSVVNLWKLAKALDTSVGFFFDEGLKEDDLVVRKDNRKRIVINKSKGIYELLSPDLNRKIEHLLITIKPGDETNPELITHVGEECGYVIKGTLTIRINEEEYILNEGDSIYFSSEFPHKYFNNSDEECVSIWAMTPPSF